MQALESPVEVESARVSGPAAADDVLEWADSSFSGPPLSPFDRMEQGAPEVLLPRTFAALRNKSTLRIVFLGDSIMQDAANSPIDLWLSKDRPNLRVEIITAIGGGAGMQRWNHPEDFPGHDLNLQAAVIDQRPDLVLIGGISTTSDDDTRAIITRLRDGARAIGAPQPDVLLMTGPFGEWTKASEGPTADDEEDARRLRAIAAESGIAFLDLRHVWIESMNAAIAAGQRPEKFYRDAIHGSAAGKHLQGRILAAWLSGSQESPQ